MNFECHCETVLQAKIIFHSMTAVGYDYSYILKKADFYVPHFNYFLRQFFFKLIMFFTALKAN